MGSGAEAGLTAGALAAGTVVAGAMVLRAMAAGAVALLSASRGNAAARTRRPLHARRGSACRAVPIHNPGGRQILLA